MSNQTIAPLLLNSPPLPYEIIKHTMETFWVVSTIFNLSFAIMCIYNFQKPNNPIRSPYFILIFLTTLIRAISWPIRYPNNNQSSLPFKLPPWYGPVYEIYMGFSMQIHGVIILALALNRFTALTMPLRHQQLWRPRNFTFLCFFILLYPIIPNLPIVHLFYCYWWLDKDGGYCRAKFIGTHKYVYIGNVITPVIALILNIIAVKFRYAKKLTPTTQHSAEVKLLYQSIFSTLTFTIWCLLNLAAYEMTPIIRATPEQSQKDFLLLVRNWLGQANNLTGGLYFEGGLILLFKFSTIIRESYFKFWGINLLLKKIKGIDNSVSNISVDIRSR